MLQRYPHNWPPQPQEIHVLKDKTQLRIMHMVAQMELIFKKQDICQNKTIHRRKNTAKKYTIYK